MITNFIYDKKTYVQFKSLPEPWKFHTTAGCDGCDILQVYIDTIFIVFRTSLAISGLVKRYCDAREKAVGKLWSCTYFTPDWLSIETFLQGRLFPRHGLACRALHIRLYPWKGLTNIPKEERIRFGLVFITIRPCAARDFLQTE